MASLPVRLGDHKGENVYKETPYVRERLRIFIVVPIEKQVEV